MESFALSGFIIDLILAAILIIPIIRGCKKGFISSAVGIISFAVSFVCAWIFTPVVSPSINSGFMLRAVETAVAKAFDLAGITAGSSVDLWEIPTPVLDILNRFDSDIGTHITDTLSLQREYMIPAVAKPTADILSNIAAYALIFFAAALILRIIAALIGGALKIAGLSSINRFFGGCLGALCGFFYIIIIAAILHSAWPPLCAAWPDTFDPAALNGSLILSFLERFSLSALGSRLLINR